MSVDLACDVGCAVTENQLFDFQRDFGVVHQSGASVASVVGEMSRQERAFIPNVVAKILDIQKGLAFDREQEFVVGAVKAFNERENLFGDWYQSILARRSLYPAAHESRRQVNVRRSSLKLGAVGKFK